MDKTLETILRAKIATGYDPVMLSVHVRGVNENNLEVSIEGEAYTVIGNTVSHLGSKAVAEVAAEDVATDVMPTAEEGDADAGELTAELQNRLNNITAGYGAHTTVWSDVYDEYVVVDAAGEPLAQGSLEVLEGFLTAMGEESAA